MSHAEQFSLRAVREQYADSIVVLAHGVYDIVHPGHIQHLNFARSLGDLTVVGLWSDACVRLRKGEDRPINTLANRIAVIASLKPVDIAFGIEGAGVPEEVIESVIKELQPDVYVVSTDNEGIFNAAEQITHDSGRVTRIVFDLSYKDKVHSTTNIIATRTTGRKS